MSELFPSRLVWRKATASHANSQCVEVAAAGHPLSGGAHVLVRDTKNRDGGHLAFLHADWARFMAAVKTR